jgi:hypothetical protein
MPRGFAQASHVRGLAEHMGVLATSGMKTTQPVLIAAIRCSAAEADTES